MELLSWIVGIIAVVVIGYLLSRYVQFRKYEKKINKIPGPNYVPIIGISYKFLVPFEDIVNTFISLLRKEQEAGHSMVRYWMGFSPRVFIVKGSACEVILKNPKYVDKSQEYHLAKNMLGNGILFSKREVWEKRRKMINPSFHSSVLKEFIPIFNEQTKICLQQLEKVEDGGFFDIAPYFRHLALDMVCGKYISDGGYGSEDPITVYLNLKERTVTTQNLLWLCCLIRKSIMGVKVNAQVNTSNDYVIAHHEIGDLFCKRMFNPFLNLSFLFNLTPYKSKELKYCKIIHTFAQKVIRERMQYLEQRKLQSNMQNGAKETDEKWVCGKKRRLATLDLLLEATCDGRKLTDEELLDEVIIEIAAGHETTSDSMGFVVYCLGRNPEVQKRAQEEVDSLLGDSDHPLTSDDLLNLKYMDAVIKETYRLYPPIPLMGREMDEDVVVDGYTIPAKTTVGIVLFVIHRDPKVFPDPDKFDPDRFLGSNTNRPSMYEYMPFSQGPRNCIGYKMGVSETKIAVAQILRKYDIISLEKPEDLKLTGSPDLRSIHGFKVCLQRRKQS